MLQQPDVGAEADPGSEDNQVCDGANACGCPTSVRKFAKGGGDDEVHGPGYDHLPGTGGERVDTFLPPFRQRGSHGPGERGEDECRGGEELLTSQSSSGHQFGPEEHGDTGDAEDESDIAFYAGAITAEHECVDDEEPQGRDGDDERSESGGHDLFCPGERHVGNTEQEAANDGELCELRQGDANA